MTPAGLDRATLYAMGFRALSLITGPITVWFIATRFSPGLQGYFYTFNAILTMQALLELGLGTALQQITSHEWAHLGFDARGHVTGDASARGRLATVLRFACLWFSAAGALAIVGFGLGGQLFFSAGEGATEVDWQSPWWILSVIAGMTLFLSPAWSILEGCNQVRQVYGFRLAMGLLSRAGLWITMLAGGGLWSLVVDRGITLVMTAAFFLFRYAPFFKSLFGLKAIQHRFWKDEIWPLQWRFAVVWISGYLPSLFIPVLFAYHGPETAGRIGMTWAIASALLSVSHAIIMTRIPRMAMHVATRAFAKLDLLFGRAIRSCVFVLVAGSACFLAALYWLDVKGFEVADRFLPFLPTLLLLGATLFIQVRHALGAYLRAHKKEPYLALSMVEAVLNLAILFPLGKAFGAMGVASGYCAVALVIYVPAHIIFLRCKKEWHDPESQTKPSSPNS